MFKATVIGNLGANAEFHNENGSEFITFKVAHNERFRDSTGNTNERSVWVSCIMSGRAEGLMPYLVKGATIAVFGDLRLKTYHSAKMHSLVAGADLFVRSVDLVGGRPDNVPSRLYDHDGIEHKIGKFFYCDTAKGQELLTQSGEQYTVDADGWVTPLATPAGDANTPVIDNSDNAQQTEVFDGQPAQEADDAKKTKEAKK